MIPVTRTFLPPLEEFTRRLETVWASGWVTNNGEQVKALGDSLRSWLDAPHLELVGNGTLALQLAIRALELKGEIITTPYSYVASATSILWEGCEPVFVDIDARTLCLDPALIEAAVTERTTAILATHVYGRPCDVEAIAAIASRHGLRVIYDAAHAFGVRLRGRPLLDWGDLSALSFHATKVFHTVEGGALACRDADMAARVRLLRAFGHVGEDDYLTVGINAKLSELHAAMGLCLLPSIPRIIDCRRQLTGLYDRALEGTELPVARLGEEVEYNFAYYPAIFPSHEAMMRCRQALLEAGAAPRRYFHPSLNTLPYLNAGLRRPCPVSESIASRVLCLPLFVGLDPAQVERIGAIVRRYEG